MAQLKDTIIDGNLTLSENSKIYIGNNEFQGGGYPALDIGEGLNSLQLLDSSALGENSLSLGTSTVANCKGYYYSHVDISNKQIYLTTQQTTPQMAAGAKDTNFVTPAYSLGAGICMVNGSSAYTYTAKIKSIENNVVTYDGDIGFTAIDGTVQDNNGLHDYSFFVPSQPLIGSVLLTNYGFACGRNTVAAGRDSFATGYKTIAACNGAYAEGSQTIAGKCAHAEGQQTKAYGMASHAEGDSSEAIGNRSHAEGNNTKALGFASHAEGIQTEAKYAAHAEGYLTKAYGNYSHAEGASNLADGSNAHAEGAGNESKGNSSHVEGGANIARGNYSHVEGYGNKPKTAVTAQHIQGKYSDLDGLNLSNYAHIVGWGPQEDEFNKDGSIKVKHRKNIHTLDVNGTAWFAGDLKAGDISLQNINTQLQGAINTSNSAEKVANQALDKANSIQSGGVGKAGAGENSEIFNNYEGTGANTAGGANSHAEGYLTKANGDYSHTEGYNTVASDESDINYVGGMHAEGYQTQAIGRGAHSEGCESKALKRYSHAEGGYTQAIGIGSHSEGLQTSTDGNYSHVEGYKTYTNHSFVHVQGKFNAYNVENDNYAHILGIGSTNNRENGFTVSWKGEGWFKKSVGSDGQDYAEYFEWLDKNLLEEDRVGYIVSLDGDKIKFAEPGDDILGIVSGTASIIGDVSEWEWNKKFLTDDFGRTLYEEVEEFDLEGNSLGIFKYPVLNPDYDPTQTYINREHRPEWDIVGMLGKLYVRDDGTCIPNFYATVGENGKATSSLDKTNMRVLSRVNDSVIRVLLK